MEFLVNYKVSVFRCYKSSLFVVKERGFTTRWAAQRYAAKQQAKLQANGHAFAFYHVIDKEGVLVDATDPQGSKLCQSN